ncbi:MAG: hypothetical protein CMJ37_04355 [Phycisphaerae bacterium]|nr:hypothetical protein [Phycisphaerae bacterium]
MTYPDPTWFLYRVGMRGKLSRGICQTWACRMGVVGMCLSLACGPSCQAIFDSPPQTTSVSDDDYADVVPTPPFSKDHPVMISPSTYSEDAWKHWHSTRVDRLSAPEGWLSLVGLDFLPTTLGQTLSFGGPDADLSPEGFPAQRMGEFVLGRDGWRFQAADHEDCTFDGKNSDEGLLQTDAVARSTELRVGGGLLVLIERGGRVALRSRHPHAKSRTAFSGIPCWPWQESAVVTGTFVSAESGRTFQAANALGEMEENPLGGTIRFAWPHSTSESDTAEVVTYELIGTSNGDGSLFVVFADATSGGQSYGGGRFLSIAAPDDDGRVVIDFNRSVNPPCAFTPFATCPRPPLQNRLPFAIEAGEMTPREH